MIQIRKGIFETNSSSANILIIPKDQSITIPKRFIYMDDETSRKPAEIVLTNLFNTYRGIDKEDVDKVINLLYANGVEEIIYGGHESYIESAIEKFKDKPENLGVPRGWTKEKLLAALFGNYTECEYFSDGEPRPTYGPAPKYEPIDEDDKNWYKEYYAG